MCQSYEGNHRSDVALVIHHRHCDFTTFWLKGLKLEDVHPAYDPMNYGTYTFTFSILNFIDKTAYLRIENWC